MEDVRAKGEDHLYVYFASKYLAERATWDFAKEHPNVDIATGEYNHLSTLLYGSI